MGSNVPISQGLFPLSNSTSPFSRTELHELDSRRSSPELPSKYDILIIGAGYAGITTAIHLFDDKDFEKSVVLLEVRRACSGVTARNGILPCTTFPNINTKLHKRLSASANLAQPSWEQQQI
jgi:cation diffusion facilitator CzcD-associated flavoprotein CzcO